MALSGQITADELNLIYAELVDEICDPGMEWDLSQAPEFADELISSVYPARHRVAREEPDDSADSQSTEPRASRE